MCPCGYQQYNGFAATHVTVNQVPKCISCYNAIVLITRRVHCFYDYTHTLLS